MRVVAGTYRGRKLVVPAGRTTRPTADRVREAIFSSLGSVEGLRVLDLFAGSGALGIEALSRGATTVTFVDRDARAVAAIRRNLDALGVEAELLRSDYASYLRTARQSGQRFDLVFIDPPYRLASELTERISATLPEVLTVDARVVCESDRREPLELEMNLGRERNYGDTLVRIYDTH